MKDFKGKVAILMAPLEGSIFYQALSAITFFIGGATILGFLLPQVSIIMPYVRMSLFVVGLFVSVVATLNCISIKYLKKWSKYGLELIILIVLIIAISYFPEIIIDIIIDVFALFLATILIIKIVCDVKRAIYFILPSFIIFIVACLSVIKYLSYNFVSPLFVERLLITGLNLDTLFRVSLSNILNNYATVSVGINGLQGFDAYFFAEYLYGRLAVISGVGVFEFYNYGTILVVLPLFFMVFCVSVGKFNFKLKSTISVTKEILIPAIVFLLLVYSPFPLEFFQSIGLFGGSSIASESQLVALIFVTIAVQNLWAMHQKISVGEEDIHFHGIVILALIAILTITKTPAVMHLLVFVAPYFLAIFLYTRKFKFLFFGITPLFFLIGVLSTVEQIQVNLPFEERFLYFQYQYIRGAWPLLLFFLIIIPTISYCLIRSADFSGAPGSERFFRGAVLGLGASLLLSGIFPFVGLIWRVAEHFGSLEYFWDYAVFIPVLILTYIVLNKLPSDKGALWKSMKSLPLPVIAVFGLALIFKVSDVISVSQNALWLQVNTINQVLMQSSSPINPDDICKAKSDSCLERSFESLKKLRCLKEFYENYEKNLKILAHENIFKSLPDNSTFFQMGGLINQLIELNKTAQLTDISRTAIYIGKDYRNKLRLHGHVWKPRQLCDPLPYLVPAISGYAAIWGLTENECRYYGQGNLDKEFIKRVDVNDPTEQELCTEARRYGFRKILILRNPAEIRQIDCQ